MTPAERAALFAMPPGMALRYDQPDPAIAACITGYHVYRSHGPAVMGQVDWFLPGTANVRVTLDAGPISVAIGNRVFDPTPQAALYGPTGHALRAVTNGGIMIGFGVSALGWARLFGPRPSAAAYRDRITPVADLLGAAVTADLVARLTASDRDAEVKPVLDAFLAEHLGPPRKNETEIRKLAMLIVEEDTIDLPHAAATIGISENALRRLAIHHFGFPPKLLLRRARFLRSLMALWDDGAPDDYSRIAASYFDTSHFLRDADQFLGMTPRRFMALNTPFLDASVRARAAVLGAPTQVLHRPPPGDAGA
jgi:hypothetical protein